MEIIKLNSWAKSHNMSNSDDELAELIPNEYPDEENSKYLSADIHIDHKKFEINHVPMFEWSINFTENKGIPVRPFRNINYNTIPAKPYK